MVKFIVQGVLQKYSLFGTDLFFSRGKFRILQNFHSGSYFTDSDSEVFLKQIHTKSGKHSETMIFHFVCSIYFRTKNGIKNKYKIYDRSMMPPFGTKYNIRRFPYFNSIEMLFYATFRSQLNNNALGTNLCCGNGSSY